MANIEDLLALTDPEREELDALEKKYGPIKKSSTLSKEDQDELNRLEAKHGPVGLAPEGMAEEIPQEAPLDIDPLVLAAARQAESTFGRDPLAVSKQLSKNLGRDVEYAPPKQDLIENPDLGGKISNAIEKLSTIGRGGYVFKKPGSKEEYQGVLDPNMFAQLYQGKYKEALKDFPQDVADVLPSMAKGVPSLMAGAGVGLKTAAALSPLSPFVSIPAGIGAGALTAGGVEVGTDLFKQLAGKIPFPEQEVSLPAALESGAMTALTYPLMGGMASKKAIKSTAEKLESEGIKKYIDEFGLSTKLPKTASEIENLLSKSQSGILPEATKSLYSWASGTPKKILENYVKYGDRIREFEAGNKIQVMKDIQSQVKTNFFNKKDVIGADLQIANNSFDLKVSNLPAERPFAGLLKKLEAKRASGEIATGAGTDIDEAIDEVKNILRSKFQKEVSGEPSIPAGRLVDESGQPIIQGIPGTPATTERIPTQTSLNSLVEFQSQVKPLMNMKEHRLALNPNKAPKTSSNAYDNQIESAAKDSYFEANEEASRVIKSIPPGERPKILKLKKDYATLADLERDVQNKFKTAESTERALFAAEKDPNGIPLERLKQIDEALGTKLVDESAALKAHESIGKIPQGAGVVERKINPKPLSTVAGILGGTAGFAAGRTSGPDAAWLLGLLGGAGGAALGRKIVNPDVSRNLIRALSSRPGQAIRTGATYANPSIWELLANQYGKPNTEKLLKGEQ